MTHKSYFFGESTQPLGLKCLRQCFNFFTSLMNDDLNSKLVDRIYDERAQSQKKRKLFGQLDFPCKNFPDGAHCDIVKLATKVLKTAILLAMSNERKNLNLYFAKYILHIIRKNLNLYLAKYIFS